MAGPKRNGSLSNRTKRTAPGSHLRKIRLTKQITLSAVAEHLGYSKGYISAIETGAKPLPQGFIERYAEVLELSEEEVSALSEHLEPSEVRYWNIPYKRNDFFMGREHELTRLGDYFAARSTLASVSAITGISGIGKTAFAIEYAFRHRSDYQAILWLKAQTPEILAASFADLANLLELPEKGARDLNKIGAIVRQWLQANPHCLLVFDNLDEIPEDEDFFASLGKNHIIITTRVSAAQPDIQCIELGGLKKEESILLLLRRSELVTRATKLESVDTRVTFSAAQIVEHLGNLPFILEQAAAYIEETGFGLDSYLTLLQKEQRELFKVSTPPAQNPFIAWSLSFQKIASEEPEVAQLLYLCAFLHPDMIYREMVLEGSTALPHSLQALTGNVYELNRAIKKLLRYSLISSDVRSGAISLHRLVQTTLRDTLSLEEQRHWAEHVVRLMNAVFPLNEVATWHITWKKCQIYINHAKEAISLIEHWSISNDESRELLHKTGGYLHERTDFKGAEYVYKTALRLDQHTGKAAAVIVQDLSMLARFYQEQGNAKQAESYYKQAIQLIDLKDGVDRYEELFKNYILLLRALNKEEEIRALQKEKNISITKRRRTSSKRRVVNDTDEDIRYSGLWASERRRWDDYGTDAHITSEQGASFQYEFSGYGIQVISNLQSLDWELDVFIDGIYVQTITSLFFEGQTSQTIIFNKTDLSNVKHSIKVDIISGTFVLDALAVLVDEEEDASSIEITR
jgi:transcriptional regulator with XRE-family HTH domain